MEAFSALIYIKPNTATDEKIAVGLLASGVNKVHFAFSKTKLHKAFALANMNNTNNPIERYLKNISKSIAEDNLKEIHFSDTYILNKEYINYLNRYDNGIVYFEKPSPMAFPINDIQFAEIFKLMLGDSLPLFKPKNTEISFSKFLHGKIEKRPILNQKADVIYSVEPVNIKGIGFPIDVDYISVNGSIYAGMHIDFNTEPSTIIKHYYEFKNLAVGLDDFSIKKKYKNLSSCSIYFNVPEGREQKDILDRLRKDDTMKGVTLKEAEQVEKDAEEIEKRDTCRKFTEELKGVA